MINWQFTDSHELLTSTLEHGALTWIDGRSDPYAEATVTTTRPSFESIILGQRTVADEAKRGEINLSGDPTAVSDLLALLVSFNSDFPIVEPIEPAQMQ